MYLLNVDDYWKARIPLSEVSFNNLFARSVIEKKVHGKVYVDDADTPQTFYVVHSYGMSLLFGKSDNESFNEWFKEYSLNEKHERTRHEWMQAYPEDWDPVLEKLFEGNLIDSRDNIDQKASGIIEFNTRVNFKFNEDLYSKGKLLKTDPDIAVRPTDKNIFQALNGSVVPLYFWNSAEDFERNGVGFSLFYKDELVSTAYSSFVHDNMIELGIETMERHRGKGYARQACQAIIDYCIEHSFEPVWACRLENIGSYKLAEKLGFEPVRKIPYYRLST